MSQLDLGVDDLKGILRDLVQALYQVQESGEDLSEDVKMALADTFELLLSRLDEAEDREKARAQAVEAPPSSDAQLIWVLSGQDPKAFVEYLKSFPTPDTQALLSDPQQLEATIEKLATMIPQGAPLVVDGIPHADLPSSTVWGAQYDEDTGKMRVRFHGGSEYEYDGIPKQIFSLFIHGRASAKTDGRNRYGRWYKNKIPSLGAALDQYVKRGQYRYRRIK